MINLIFYLSSQTVVKVPIAEREVNVNVIIGNWTCEDLVVTWKEDWSTDYSIWHSLRAMGILLYNESMILATTYGCRQLAQSAQRYCSLP